MTGTAGGAAPQSEQLVNHQTNLTHDRTGPAQQHPGFVPVLARRTDRAAARTLDKR
jgi:hypothetical protein